jgi:hypothetical protein
VNPVETSEGGRQLAVTIHAATFFTSRGIPMTMTFVHKAATAVLLVAAAAGAQAVETYSEDFNSLFFDFKNKTGNYGDTNVLAGYSGTSFSGGWTEVGAVAGPRLVRWEWGLPTALTNLSPSTRAT